MSGLNDPDIGGGLVIESIDLVDLEVRERVREVAERTSLIEARVNSGWLHDGELRMDAEYYSDSALRVRRLLEEWELGTELLGDLVRSVSYPGRFKRIYAQDKRHGMPFLTASKMLHFRPASDVYLARRAHQLARYTVTEGCLLITRSGSVGRCVVAGKRLSKFAITDDAIRVKSSKIPIGYLYAFLVSWMGQTILTKDQYGSTIKHLESHHVSNIPVPLLSETEMKEVAERIDEANDLREQANVLLDDALKILHYELGLPDFDESLVEYLTLLGDEHAPQLDLMKLRAFEVQASTLQERLDASYHVPVVRSAISTLQNGNFRLVPLADFVKNIMIPPRFKRIYVSADYGVPFIRPSQLPQTNFYNLGHISRRTPSLGSLMLKQGDVLISTDGTVGRIAIATKFLDGWAGSNNLGRVTCDNEIGQNGYLAAFLMSPYGQYQLLKEIYGGVVDHIDVSHIQGIMIPDAPTDLQRRIGKPVVKAFENKDRASTLEMDAIRALESKIVSS